jgi:hypothetical protein
MLREISISFLPYQREDTSTSLEEILLSRPKMDSEPKFGTSIKDQEPSSPETTTNPSTSRAQEDQTTSKSGVPTLTGGKSSDIKVDSS